MKPLPLLLALLPLAGCAQFADYLPTVSFGRLDVNDLDWERIDTDFVFMVNNPNPIDIGLDNFDYALALGGVELLSGADPDGLELIGEDESEMALPVSMNFQDLFDVVEAVRGEDAYDFGLAGSFGFDTPLGVVDLPYDAEGQFPALRTPSFDLSKVRIADFDITTATIEIDMDVDNDHGSTLWFEDFDYSLDMAESQVATGFLADLGAVDGASTGTVTLPVELDFISLGTAIYDALTGDEVRVGLSASTNVVTPFEGFTIPLSIDESGKINIE